MSSQALEDLLEEATVHDESGLLHPAFISTLTNTPPELNARRRGTGRDKHFHQGLRDQGVPVRLAVYKGFGHGITKPKSNRAVMTHNEEWFGKWIWGDNESSTEETSSGRK